MGVTKTPTWAPLNNTKKHSSTNGWSSLSSTRAFTVLICSFCSKLALTFEPTANSYCVILCTFLVSACQYTEKLQIYNFCFRLFTHVGWPKSVFVYNSFVCAFLIFSNSKIHLHSSSNTWIRELEKRRQRRINSHQMWTQLFLQVHYYQAPCTPHSLFVAKVNNNNINVDAEIWDNKIFFCTRTQLPKILSSSLVQILAGIFTRTPSWMDFIFVVSVAVVLVAIVFISRHTECCGCEFRMCSVRSSVFCLPLPSRAVKFSNFSVSLSASLKRVSASAYGDRIEVRLFVRRIKRVWLFCSNCGFYQVLWHFQLI